MRHSILPPSLLAGLCLLAALPTSTGSLAAASPPVTLLRVPGGGIQPQVALDSRGHLHLLYFKGRPAAGDLYYVRSSDGGHTFTRPLRVNHHDGSAMAIGNIRGGHLALGRQGRPHVAWMGSSKARPRGPKDAAPMLYTRLNDAGTEFEPERNLITIAAGLDGGGSVAADPDGNVFVCWHAPQPGTSGEAKRCVWVARSTDEGRSFAREQPACAEPTGACGCCGMRVQADPTGNVYLIYRSAREGIHRDMVLLTSTDRGAHFTAHKVDEWEIKACPMSTCALFPERSGVLASWETRGQVWFGTVSSSTGIVAFPTPAPGEGRDRKHPTIARNERGETLLVWTEGMGWDRGGSLTWQLFDRHGKPLGKPGRADGVPTWSLVAACYHPEHGFLVLY